MKPKYLTLTGADDSVQVEDLLQLSDKYPFVEWGILFSKSQNGNPRYPTYEWIDELAEAYYYRQESAPEKFSLHLCGENMRLLLKGDDRAFRELGSDIMEMFGRVQLNTPKQDLEWDVYKLIDIIKSYPNKQFIFPLKGGFNEAHSRALVSEAGLQNISFLFDDSGGKGISPKDWNIPSVSNVSTGYAGGLGPDNIYKELGRVQSTVAIRSDFTADYWLDMETKLRSGDALNPEEKFDLEKCVQVLEIAKRWF